jgi:hypothetical protein
MTTNDFSPGAVVSRTFAVWKGNVVSFSAVALAVQSPTIVLTAVWDSVARRAGEEPSRALWMLSTLLGFIATGALTGGALRGVRGRRVRPGEMLKVGLRRIWMVLPVAVVAQAAVLLGLVVLVVPGLALVAGLWVAVPAAVAERWKGTSDALSRSWELTKGRRWNVLAVALVTLAVAFGFSLLGVTALDAAAEWGANHPFIAALEEAIEALAAGFVAVAAAVSYHELRASREGMDEAELAVVFD